MAISLTTIGALLSADPLVANQRALELMNGSRLEIFTVVRHDVTASVLPLLLVKLFIVAFWWDHRPSDPSVNSPSRSENHAAP